MSQSPSQSSTKTPSDTRSNASTKAEQTPETPPKEKSGSNSDPGKGPKKSNDPDNESKKANDTSNGPKTTSKKKETGKRSKLKKISAARESQKRASDAHDQLPRKFQSKTVASNDTKTLSGYKPDEVVPDSFSRTKDMGAEAMLEHSKQLDGYKPTRTGANDPKDLPGGNAATHSEKQLGRYHELIKSDKPIGVSTEQCGDCRNWFQKQTANSKKEHVVGDPEFTRIYKPDGSVEVYDMDNRLIKQVEVGEPPTATITKYKGIPW
jgi:hypothetical protein